MFNRVLWLSGVNLDFFVYVRYCFIIDFGINIRMTLGIVIILCVDNLMVFFSNGKFWIIWGLVMKFKKWSSCVGDINNFVWDDCGIGIFFLWSNVCFFVVVNLYWVRLGIYFFRVWKVILFVIIDSICCWVF